jgi:hypothetical protein
MTLYQQRCCVIMSTPYQDEKTEGGAPMLMTTPLTIDCVAGALGSFPVGVDVAA